MNNLAIECHGIAKSYGALRSRTEALKPTSLFVPAGSIFALLGHNGAGKTTLIKLLVNILRPSSGHATVLNTPSTSVAGESFTRIGYVSENQELPEWMTVQAFLRYQSGFYPHWDDTELIRRFELPLKRKLKNLSRGQRMKVALASILAFQPELIILDEPFSGLDPVVRDELIEALLDSASLRATAAVNTAAQPLTVVLSSHDLAEIESFATHVAFLSGGALLFAEEMSTLSNRFREVTVTLAPIEQAQPSLTPPPSWLRTQQTAHALRFVHSQAETEPIEQQVRELFPSATTIDTEPMSLRSIFLALAKSGPASNPTEGER